MDLMFGRMFDRAIRKLSRGDISGAKMSALQMGTFYVAIAIEDVHDTAFQAAIDLYQQDGGDEGRWLQFFKYIVENWEKIAKIIADAIGMFGLSILIEELESELSRWHAPPTDIAFSGKGETAGRYKNIYAEIARTTLQEMLSVSQE